MNGRFISQDSTFIQVGTYCLLSTPSMDKAAKFLPIVEGDNFRLFLLGTADRFFTMDTRGFVTTMDGLQADNAYPRLQHFRINDNLINDNDFDQYFWICNSASGAVLSLGGNFSEGAPITTAVKSPRTDQLWTFRNGMIVCKANGLVLRCNDSISGSPVSAALPGNPVAGNQKWAISQNGTIIAENNLGLHSPQRAPGGAITIMTDPPVGEWYLTPCVMEPSITENQLEMLQSGDSFYLHNAANDLVLGVNDTAAAGSAVIMQTAVPHALHQLWMYRNDRIVSRLGDWVLDVEQDGLVINPLQETTHPPTQDWLLTGEGHLLLDQEEYRLAEPDPSSNRVRTTYYNPVRSPSQRWYLEVVSNNQRNHPPQLIGGMPPSTPVTSLKVEMKIADAFWGGSDDHIFVSFAGFFHMQLFKSIPERGKTYSVEIDLSRMFPDQSVTLGDLRSFNIFQRPGLDIIMESDDWKLESIVFIVNERYYNRAFQWVNQWIHYVSINAAVWSRIVPDRWDDTSPESRKNWMRIGYNAIKDKSLRQLTIPGSHDAGMYLGGVAVLGKTQDLSIYQQLQEGVRYFDLRPQWVHTDLGDGDRDLCIFHGLVLGPLFSDVLEDVQRFMSTPDCRELVILKISHYSNFSDTAYRVMIQKIQSKLGTWLHTESTSQVRIADKPMSAFIASRGTVLVMCDESYPLNNRNPGIFVYRDSYTENSKGGEPHDGDLTVFDWYANTTTPDTMKNDQIDKFNAFDGICKRDRNVACDLFLLSWTLTPVTAVWFYAKEVNPILEPSLLSLTQPNSHGYQINIIYIDYVQYSHATDICRRLNGITG